MKQIHVISHTHWDREWYQTYQQFRIRLVHMLDKLLALLEADPDYRYFTLDGQTIVLEDYLEIRPHLKDTIKNYIRSGRLLIGPWYILPDEFLVSPEATIRNLLLGKKICTEFGGRMMIGYIPDPFGHISQMPQILKGFGIHTACFWRGLSDEPCELLWQAPDGSQVFTLYLRDSYSNGAGLITGDPLQFTEGLSRCADSLFAQSATDQAVIMLGTDHMEPPIDTSKAILAAAEQLKDRQILHSTLPLAIQSIQEDLRQGNVRLPVVNGELRSPKRMPLLPGVLSARAWIKQRNRQCENLLEKWVEPFSTWANWSVPAQPLNSSCLSSPQSLINQAWKLLIQCHPHDSICGCSIDQVHEEMRPRFDQVEQIGEEIVRQSIETLTSQISTTPPEHLSALFAIVVYNPTDSLLTDVVTTTLNLPSSVTRIKIVDHAGQEIPHQMLGLGNNDLVAMTLDRKGLEEAANMIHEGRVAGMVVKEIHSQRTNDVVHIELILSVSGDPDLEAWARGNAELRECLNDPTVHTFIVHARTAQTCQITFTAPYVPSIGYRTFWVCPVPTPETVPAKLNPLIRMAMPLTAHVSQHPRVMNFISRISRQRPHKPYRIENEYLVVEAMPKDGTITLVERETGLRFIGLNQFIDSADNGDEYNYSPPPDDQILKSKFHHIEIEKGVTQQVLTLHLRLQIPKSLSPDRKSRSSETITIPIKTRITLNHRVKRVDFETEIENFALDHRLRVHFPAPFRTDHADYDSHFTVIRRPTTIQTHDADWVEAPRPEVPQRGFTTISDGTSSMTLLNQGLPEIETLQGEPGTELALTLLRCVGWLSRDDFSTRKGHAGPMMETPGAQQIGKHTFHYAIIPHQNTWQEVSPSTHGFLTPMRAVTAPIQKGDFPADQSLLTCSNELQITAIKMSEDNSGIIVRGWAVEDCVIEYHCSIPLISVYRATLDETMQDSIPLESEKAWRVAVRKDEIITLLLKPKQ